MSKQDIVYQLIRCKRRSTALYVKNTGEVVVRAPYFVSNKQIDTFVQSHQLWITQKLEEHKTLNEQKLKFTLTEGDMLTILGKEYPIIYGEKACFSGEHFFIPKGTFEQIRTEIIAEYKRLAKALLTERVEYYSNITGLKAESIKISAAKTRWGSCSGTNRLNFTWKLILADLNTVDYVVLHELAHTKEHNHSKRFWSLVESYMPDYKKYRENLLKVQYKLSLENWD